jgi:hypothetical protein
MQRTQRAVYIIRYEWPLLVSVVTTAVFLVFGKGLLGDFSNAAWFALMLGWLFGAILTRLSLWYAMRRVWPFGWANPLGRLYSPSP